MTYPKWFLNCLTALLVVLMGAMAFAVITLIRGWF